MTSSVLAVGLWCSSSDRAWSWTPRPYVGAWAIVAGLLALAVWWARRGRRDQARLAADLAAGEARMAETELGMARSRLRREPTRSAEGSSYGHEVGTNRTRSIALVIGAIGLWSVLDWPLATLGAGYLATAQLIRQVVMVMVVAPLLLFACPAGLAIRLVGWGKRLTLLRWTARPIFAVPFAATSLVVVCAPTVLDTLVRTPYGAFGMDIVWMLAGFVLWMPVQCPHPGVRRLVGAGALTYLIGQSVVPVLPGFFMTWADFPIYRTYELAPRVFQGFTAVQDQQTAAAVLQVGGMSLLWLQIAYRFLKWGYEQIGVDRDGLIRDGRFAPVPSSSSTPTPEDGLTA